MKKQLKLFTILLCLVVNAGFIKAQDPVRPADETTVIFLVIKNDGARFVGNIISQDAREVLIETKELGQIYIPRHEIREIRELPARELTPDGEYIPGEVFSTRYFISTNGLPVEKGDNYMLFSLIGPDFQFSLADNFGIGVMTSWLATPVILSLKYSIPVKDDYSIGLGLLAGMDTWARTGIKGVLPFAAFTHGNRRQNITYSIGYGTVGYRQNHYDGWLNEGYTKKSESRFLFSLAGMVKVRPSFSFVFDSFIASKGGEYKTANNSTKTRPGFALLMPGLRFQTNPERAFQFSFGGIIYDREFSGSPIPMAQFFRKF